MGDHILNEIQQGLVNSLDDDRRLTDVQQRLEHHLTLGQSSGYSRG